MTSPPRPLTMAGEVTGEPFDIEAARAFCESTSGVQVNINSFSRALDEIERFAHLIAKQDREIQELRGIVGVREAELASVNGRMAEIDRARVVGVTMCAEKDAEIQKLRDAIDQLRRGK